MASAGITYSISAPSSAQDEGGTVTFTITDGGSTSASKVYIKTVDGTAIAGEDYKGITAGSTAGLVEFGTSDASKTITVELYSDSVTDDNEGFYLELYKSEQDMTNGTVHKEAKALINDVTAVVDNYTYTVAANSNSSSSPAEEGQNITFTITRSGSSGQTKVYLNTTPGSADSSDYTEQIATELVFADGETSKTVNVATTSDSVSEDKEYFWFDLYKNKVDAEAKGYNYDAYGRGYIIDAGGGGGGGNSQSYTYTVANTNTLNG